MVTLPGCAGRHLTVLDDGSPALEGCSPLPSCVSSSAWILYNRTAQFELLSPWETAWPAIKEAVARIPRTEIIESDNVYLHAKCRSRVFGFVDNLELLLHPDKNRISVRSAAAIGLFDFGVNRWRLYSLRKQLEEMKIIKE